MPSTAIFIFLMQSGPCMECIAVWANYQVYSADISVESYVLPGPIIKWTPITSYGLSCLSSQIVR